MVTERCTGGFAERYESRDVECSIFFTRSYLVGLRWVITDRILVLQNIVKLSAKCPWEVARWWEWCYPPVLNKVMPNRTLQIREMIVNYF